MVKELLFKRVTLKQRANGEDTGFGKGRRENSRQRIQRSRAEDDQACVASIIKVNSKNQYICVQCDSPSYL